MAAAGGARRAKSGSGAPVFPDLQGRRGSPGGNAPAAPGDCDGLPGPADRDRETGRTSLRGHQDPSFSLSDSASASSFELTHPGWGRVQVVGRIWNLAGTQDAQRTSSGWSWHTHSFMQQHRKRVSSPTSSRPHGCGGGCKARGALCACPAACPPPQAFLGLDRFLLGPRGAAGHRADAVLCSTCPRACLVKSTVLEEPPLQEAPKPVAADPPPSPLPSQERAALTQDPNEWIK